VAQQLNIRVPATLRDETKKAAEAEGVSINQFCTVAIARAVGEWQARQFFQRRSRGLAPDIARDRMRALLNRVSE
jgi:uncharacterized protein (DUF1778 family)